MHVPVLTPPRMLQFKAVSSVLCPSSAKIHSPQGSSSSDIKLSRWQEFAQLSPGLGGLLGEAWQPGRASEESEGGPLLLGGKPSSSPSVLGAWW